MIVGNKSDKTRVVSEQDAKQWCVQNGGYAYIETSAINGTNVETVFRKAAELTAAGDSMDFGMPTSLSGAGGAMKLDPAVNFPNQPDLNQKKKKGCC